MTMFGLEAYVQYIKAVKKLFCCFKTVQLEVPKCVQKCGSDTAITSFLIWQVRHQHNEQRIS